MRGHVKQRSKGSWSIVIDIGKDPATGKRRQQWYTVKGTKREADSKMRELLETKEKGTYIHPNKLTLSDWLDKWLEGYVKINCSVRTFDAYQSIVKIHLKPSLGSIPLTQLKPQQIQDYYSKICQEKGGLSASSVLHVHRILFQALKYAMRQGVLVQNAADLVDPPRVRKPKMRTLIPTEIARLFEVTKDGPYHAIYFTAINTGLRQAELLGLRWRDVDLDLASLSVNQVLYKRRGICIFKEPKSEHSRRRLDLAPSLAIYLRKYRSQRQAEYIVTGAPLTDDDLVFGNTEGKPTDPSTLTHQLSKALKRAGLPHVRFHDLRHSFASLMLMAGIHPKIVSEMLGHASVTLTLDTYSHVIGGLQKAAICRLDDMLQMEIRAENKSVSNPLAKS
ncbi:MAG: site-specific integrase [Dehalococcoidia bacterium]|jgi:integrase